MNKLKDRIHCYLYFLNFSNRGFTDFEAPIFEKIIKIKEAKIIYVITHSPPNLEEDDIEEYINNFNESINKLSQNKIFNDNQKKELKIILEASKKMLFL
jgi:septin family protein